MPHKAKKDPKGCKGRKHMKHELEITKRQLPWAKDCGWSSYGVRGGGFKRWYYCIHQKSCKKCGKLVEWSLKNYDECPDWKRYDRLSDHLRKLLDPDLDSLPIEE